MVDYHVEASKPLSNVSNGQKKLQHPGWRVVIYKNKPAISLDVVSNLQPPEFSGGFSFAKMKGGFE